VKDLFTKLGIPRKAVQYVSFIGANIAELIVFDSFKDDVVRKLTDREIQLDPSFDPLSPKPFTDADTVKKLGLAGKSEEEKSVVARQTFVSRLDSMLQTIGHHRPRLR
jgi:hypothetical protein